jgi:hypothetical protein
MMDKFEIAVADAPTGADHLDADSRNLCLATLGR